VRALGRRVAAALVRYLPELRYVRRPEFPRGGFDYERYWQELAHEAASNGIPVLKRWHHNLFGHQMCFELHRLEEPAR